MNFFQFFQNNKLFIHYLTVVIVVLGVMSLSEMQKEARPNVNFNRVAITAIYPGASPTDIEELVVDPIEEKIDEVDGVEEYRSVSFSGAGSISVQIDDEYPDVDEVIDEIRRKVSEVKDLPSEVEDPAVVEIKAINIPILRLALYGNLKPFEMKLEVEKLKDYINKLPGVQSVSESGIEDLQMKILAHPNKLDVHDITLIEMMSRLQQWSKQRPAGQLENQQVTTNLTVGYDYNDINLLENFVVRSNDSGRKVKVSDVAKVEYDTERTQVRSLYAAKEAVLITVVKKPFSDIIETVDVVKKGLEEYSKNLPEGLEYKLYRDEATRVRNRMQAVTQNAIFGLVLVLILLIVFLDWRSAIVTSVGIPVAVLGGITLIYLMGNTMNSLVLVGMIIVLGMLVDDAIVVCENIYSYIEKGLSPAKASLKGVQEIASPVVATVLTTVLAFFPILFMEEIIGQFLRVIPLTVICMLAVSLFEALVILPIHAEEVMALQKSKVSIFSRLEKPYSRYLDWSIRYKWIVLFVVAVVFVVSAIQGQSLFQRFTLFPATGLEGLSVRVELKKNIPTSQTEAVLKELSEKLGEVAGKDFDSIFSTIGQVTTGGASGSRQTASHLGQITIVFTSDPEFIYREKKTVADIRQVVGEFSKKNNIKTSVTLDRPGPPIGKPIQFEVTSRDFEYGGEIVDQIRSELGKIDGVHSLESDLDGDSQRYRFVIDNDLAVSDGVNPVDISNTIFAAATGRVTNEILKNNEKVEILVGVSNFNEIDVKGILNLKVRNENGIAVPIRIFTKAIEEKAPSSIQRLNGLRTITLFGEVDEKVITGKEANARITPYIEKLQKENPTIKIDTGGGEKDRIKALRDTMKLYVLALLMVFMVISLSFQSFLYPFMVLLTIPMGICGVVWALVIHGQPLSLMGIVGIVGLSGVVVNVSIVLMKFMQDRLKEGMEFREAIIDAGTRRLRPIVITTITTLTGLLPTIYGIGGVDTFVQPLALVLGWGLFVSAALSILALPALISLVPWLKRAALPVNSSLGKE